jgi:single-strand DNA-binding protein
MARGYNRVIIMGNLARDPDVRFTPSKQKVARITVAIGRQWKNKTSGELQSHTDVVTVSAWNYVADICDRYLKKGRPVLVEGRLSVRDFDDAKTGQHRWVTEVVADNIVLLGSPRRMMKGCLPTQNPVSGMPGCIPTPFPAGHGKLRKRRVRR